ncbi:MAG: quinoprotein dehydrogenase-associated SoxYZ-like carrier [Gammaproteobacteria bacterium]
MRKYLRVFGGLLILLCSTTVLAVDEDFFWENGLRQSYFGEREVKLDDSVISLEAPKRADNAAIVPIRIRARFAQSPERYIKTVTVLVDQNPTPLAGQFHFFPESGRADLALRIRINAYTTVRAVAETNDGQLFLSKRFVKASGGCSAPMGTDLDDAMARLGKMKLRLMHQEAKASPVPVQLNIRHPNLSGLQMDQLTRLYLPAHFVKKLRVTYNDTPVLLAETDISISEDPSFRFYFQPQGEGTLKAEIIDSENNSFETLTKVGTGSS